MKAIKITEANETAIEAALSEANGRSEAHAYTTYGEIENLVSAAERALCSMLYKKDWQGAQWRETSGAKVANAYKGIRNGTSVVIERRSSAWYLIAAHKTPIYNDGGGKGWLYLTVAQQQAAHDKLNEQFYVMKAQTEDVAA